MKHVVWRFGWMSGMVAALLALLTTSVGYRFNFDKGDSFSWLTLLLPSFFIIFAIKRYRDHLAGLVTLATGLRIGLPVTFISALCYAIVWQVATRILMPDYSNRYAAYELGKLQASGASIGQIAVEADLYLNHPLLDLFFLLLEPLLVGLVVTLIAALLLQRKRPQRSSLKVKARLWLAAHARGLLRR